MHLKINIELRIGMEYGDSHGSIWIPWYMLGLRLTVELDMGLGMDGVGKKLNLHVLEMSNENKNQIAGIGWLKHRRG